jgi:periplasmic protein TonB
MTKLFLKSFALFLLASCAQQPPMQPRPVDAKSAICAKPEYPNAARRYDAEGTTYLSLSVDAQGVVSNSNVEQSSGASAAHKLLDQAALQALLTCRFPGSPGYAPARGRIEYVWKLDTQPSYADKIRVTFQVQLTLSEPVEGNPTAEVEVRAAPDGKVLSSRLLRSSGSAPWDAAVQRAVAKVERLPIDNEGRVPPVMIISLRPKP